jgi:hypothetical protein
MTKRDFQAKEYAEELRQDLWPEPPQDNIFEDTSISAMYLEQIAVAMSSQNIKGASYVEDIAYQLDSLGTDYIMVVEQRDAAIRELDELKLRVGILEYIHDDPLRHREQCSEAVSAYCREAKKEYEQHAKTKALLVEVQKQLRLLQDEITELSCAAWWSNVHPNTPIKDVNIGNCVEILGYSDKLKTQLIHKSEDNSAWLDIFDKPVPSPQWILNCHANPKLRGRRSIEDRRKDMGETK